MKYVVKHPIRRNGKRLKVDDIVDLDDDVAAELRAVGAIAVSDRAPAPRAKSAAVRGSGSGTPPPSDPVDPSAASGIDVGQLAGE